MTMTDSRILPLPLDGQKLIHKQYNLQIQSKEKLTLVDDATTQLAGIDATWGIEPAALNR